jgi:phosphoglycolate phosphatase-like HAD superfamily hydrolase
MMGMSSPEWSAYLGTNSGVPMEADAISRDVVRRMEDGYRRGLPLLPGADEAVRALGARWPLGLASSSNREIIDLVLGARAGSPLRSRWPCPRREVERGKPAAGCLLEGCRELGREPGAVRGGRGLEQRAARRRGRGLAVIAVPNPHYPPSEDALALAADTVGVVGDITPELVESLELG